MTTIKFFYHTQGRFERDENRMLKYVNGKVDSIAPMDIDLVSYFDLVELFKGLGYHDLKSMQWMHPDHTCLNSGLRPLLGDNDINSMCEAAMRAGSSKECSMHLYFEHPVLGVEDVEEVDPNEAVNPNEAANPNEVDDDYESAEDSLYKPSHLTDSDSDSSSDDIEEVDSKKNIKVDSNKKNTKVDSNKKVPELCSEDSGRLSFEVHGYDSYFEQLRTPESTDDEANSRPTFPVFRESAAFGEVSLEVGMEFHNLEVFKTAVKDFNIALGREIKWKKNDKTRARAVCSVEGCPWTALCSWSTHAKTYQIKTLELEHTCCRVFRNKAATGGWVAKKLEKKLWVQPDIKRRHARNIMKEDFYVHVTQKKVARALKKAREAVEGSEKEQYARTWDYLGELLRSNPGSTAKMDVLPQLDNPPLFQRLYICLDACKRGFKAGCRPLIGLDGCFLKGYYGGQLLSAVAQDANKQFYVIAYAVVDAETKDNWKWFLTLLLDDIGDHASNGWNFMSDQQKGLLPALKELIPGVHHRNCVVHIWKNFIKQWRDKELRWIVWECAKSTTEAEFKAVMLRLKKKNERAWSYLNNIEPSAWVKAYFSHWPKIDNLTNNITEVWHSKIVEAREKPILTMLEEVRCCIMRRMAAHKRCLSTYKGVLPPVQQEKIDKLKVESNFWTPTFTGDIANDTYEVHSQRQRSKVGVSLTHRTCACQVWQLTGMPCKHAIAAIAHKNERPEDYVHHWLTMDALRATYEYYIQPVNSQEYWAATDQTKPEPPKLKRPIGRPKKHRRKDDVSEEQPSGQQKKLKRRYVAKCTKCGESGHYERTCKGPPQPGYEKRRLEKEKRQLRRQMKKTTAIVERNTQESLVDPQPRAVRPPPIRPRAQMTPQATPPPFNPFPSSAVGTPSIQPPPPLVRPFNPPRNVHSEEGSTGNMQFRFMPTPGFRPPPSK